MLYAGAATLGVAAMLALLVDQCLGEPPVRWHPVVWMGNYLARAGDWVQRPSAADGSAASQQAPDWAAFLRGTAAWLAGALVVLGLAFGVQALLLQLPWGVRSLAMGLLLKPLLAWGMLKTEVRAVDAALTGSLAAGRERLRWLVSRAVADLSAAQVRESAVETLAENFNDSVIAPLFWFAVFGLPGAAVYRFANTADAMWGYPGIYAGRNWAWAGKWAARVDDVAGWLPARLTALLLLLASGKNAWKRAQHLPLQAGQTPSPNSGWPMAAMALVLGVALRKPGVYVLNPAAAEVRAADIPRAIALANRALLVAGLLALLLLCPVWLPLLAALAAWARGVFL